MLPVIFLLASGPAKPSRIDYQKLLEADQAIINHLASENQRLKDQLRIYEPGVVKLHPRFVNEQPTCPVDGYEVLWEIDNTLKDFVPYCVKEGK